MNTTVTSPIVDNEGQATLPIDAFGNINSVGAVASYVVAVSGALTATTDEDWSFIFEVLNRAHRVRPITALITTGRQGAEAVVEQWAEYNNVRVVTYVLTDAEWTEQGKSAGPKRHARMLREQQPDVVIGFSKANVVDSATGSLLQMADERHKLTTHLFHTTTRTKEF